MDNELHALENAAIPPTLRMTGVPVYMAVLLMARKLAIEHNMDHHKIMSEATQALPEHRHTILSKYFTIT